MQVLKAIILKTTNYSDTQKIVHAYSLEMGYISFISTGFLFKKKNQGVNCMQIVEIEYLPAEKGNLHKLKTVSPFVNISNIYFDIYKMNISLLWSEILNLILRNEQKNEALFEFLQQSVEYLNSTRNDVANFNLFFLYRLVALIGFGINANTHSPGYSFNITDGCFYPPENTSGCISGPNTAGFIHSLCTCKLDELHSIALNRQGRTVLLDIILLFIGTHLNVDFNIKSIRVIREVFS